MRSGWTKISVAKQKSTPKFYLGGGGSKTNSGKNAVKERKSGRGWRHRGKPCGPRNGPSPPSNTWSKFRQQGKKQLYYPHRVFSFSQTFLLLIVSHPNGWIIVFTRLPSRALPGAPNHPTLQQYGHPHFDRVGSPHHDEFRMGPLWLWGQNLYISCTWNYFTDVGHFHRSLLFEHPTDD